jgi:Icc-related predicted phosphoesterase
MKICAISDSHGCEIDIPKCELLIIAGDISTLGDIDWFTDRYIPYLMTQEFNKCLLVFGNHDDDIHMNKNWSKIEKTLPDKIKVLTNESYIYKGIRFYGSPHCRYISGFRNTMSESILKSIFSNIPLDTDIIITHSPPYGIGDVPQGESFHLGSSSLLDKVKVIEPSYHIFGHIHTGEKYTRIGKTKYLNVSIVDERYENVFKPTMINFKEERK